MNYEIICSACGATWWVLGAVEFDTNALNLSDCGWDDECKHVAEGGEYTIGRQEPIEFEGDE